MAESPDGKKKTRDRTPKRVIGADGTSPETPSTPFDTPAMRALRDNLPEKPVPAEPVQDAPEVVLETPGIAETPAETPVETAAEVPARAEETAPEPPQDPAAVEAAAAASEEAPDDEVAQLGRALEAERPAGDGITFDHLWWDPKDGTRVFKNKKSGEFFRMYHNDIRMFYNKDGEDRARRWDTNSNKLTSVLEKSEINDPVEAAVQEAKDKGVEEGKDALRARLDTMRTSLNEEQIRNFERDINAVSTPGGVKAMQKSLIGWEPKKMSEKERRAAQSTEENQDRARLAVEKEIRRATNEKRKDLNRRLTTLLQNGTISQAFNDVTRAEIKKAKFVQELAGFEQDIAQWESEAIAQQPPVDAVPQAAEPAAPEPAPAAEPASPEPAPAAPAEADTRTERERKIANVAKQIIDNIDSNPKQDPQRAYEAGKRQLDTEDRDALHKILDAEEKNRKRRFGFIYDTRKNPLDSRRESRRALQEELNRAAGTPPPLPPEGPTNSPPNGPRGPSGSEASRRAGGTAEAKPFEINRRDYVGVEIKTVQEILADETHAQYFGELLHALAPGAHEVLQRYYHDTPTEEDMNLMTYAAHEYSKRNQQWEKLCAKLTQTDVDNFMRRNNMMQNVVRHVGGNRGLEVLKHTLRFTAMRDYDAFSAIDTSTANVHAFRDSFQGVIMDKRLQALSDTIGIKREEFEDVVDLSSPEGREASLRDLEKRFHAKAGAGRKAMDWITGKTGVTIGGSSRSKAYRVLDDAEYAMKGRFGFTKKNLKAADANLNTIGKNLSSAVGAEEIREQIAQETLRNEKRVSGAEAGPKSFAEAKEKIEAQTVEKIQEVITAKVEERKKTDPRWESGGVSYQNSVLSDIKKEEKKKLKAGTGFWAWLLGADFASKFNKAATKATGRDAHIH